MMILKQFLSLMCKSVNVLLQRKSFLFKKISHKKYFFMEIIIINVKRIKVKGR